MAKIRNSLRTKIVAAFALVSVAMVVFFQIAHSITYLYEQHALTEVNRYYSALTQTTVMLTTTLEEGEHLDQYLRTGDSQHLVAFRNSQQEAHKIVLTLQDLLADDVEAKATLLHDIKPGVDLLDIISEPGAAVDNQIRLQTIQNWQDSFPAKANAFLQQVNSLYGETRTVYIDITNKSYFILLAIGILVALGSVAVGTWVSRGITRPLARLMQGIRTVMSGDYHVVEGVSSSDEIGELVFAFNKMIKTVSEAQENLASQNEELQAQSEELAAQNEEILAQQDELQENFTKLGRQEETLNRLYGFSQQLTRTIDLDELLRNVLEGLMQEANAQVGTVLLHEPATGELRARAAIGMVNPDKLPVWHVGEGLLGRAAQSNWMMVAKFGEGQLRSQGLAGQWSMASEIYLPLQFHDELLGLVALGRTYEAVLTSDEQQRLTALADQVTVAIHNALAHLEVREALRQIQDLDRLKSELLSTVSHELRTPLASILGFTELLLKKAPNPEKARKYLSTIHSEALRLTALINDFLDLQRIENGRLDFSMEQTDLGSIIRHSVDVYQGQTNNHSFSLEIEGGLPPVWADPDRIAQVIGNLVGNAVKYSPQGGPIEIKAFRQTPMTITIAIRDQGLGIPQEALGKLFQPFYRVDNSDRREIGGTGLGLAICQKIVRAHGGKIAVESIHGQGSTFLVTLPLVNAVQAELPVRQAVLGPQSVFVAEQVAATRANENDPSVLVVEDDQAMADLLAEALAGAGYGSRIVDNGINALVSVARHLPVAVILDLTLNGSMDGWDVLRKLKQEQKTREIPVIICSAVDQRKQGLEMGAVEYLVKPFAPERLVEVLATVTAMDNGPVGLPHPKGSGNSEETLKVILESKGFAVQEMISHKDVVIVNLAPAKLKEREVNQDVPQNSQ